jgi:hypothetical protein
VEFKIKGARAWIFFTLCVVAAALFVVSSIGAWWQAVVYHPEYGYVGTLKIFQYGILPRPFYEPQFATDITPTYQVILGHIYIAASVLLILLSAGLKGRKGQWLLAGVGFIYVIYSVVAVLRIYAHTQAHGELLQGLSHIPSLDLTAPLDIDTKLLPGYYLAYVAGLWCMVLAPLRYIIAGKYKT